MRNIQSQRSADFKEVKSSMRVTFAPGIIYFTPLLTLGQPFSMFHVKHVMIYKQTMDEIKILLPTGRRIFISGLQEMTVKMIVFDNKINSYCKVAGGFLNILVLK